MGYFNDYQYRDLAIKSDDPYANAKYELILTVLTGNKALNILNAGCGSGELSFLLAKQGHTVFGIDPVQEHIDLAKRNVPLSVTDRCIFSVNSIEDISNEILYDVVVATDVLEHISDDATAAKKLAKLVRPGGLLIITVPAMPSLFGFHDEQLGHFRRYTRANLLSLVRQVGNINLKKIRYFGFTLIPVCYLYSKIWRKPYPIASSEKGLTFCMRQFVLSIILTFDRFVIMPTGTSLIFWGEKMLDRK